MIGEKSRYKGEYYYYDDINDRNYIEPIRDNIVEQDITDLFVHYRRGIRLDMLAYEYYNDASMWWVILDANPEYGNEFEIPIGTVLHIPHPDRVTRMFGDTND